MAKIEIDEEELNTLRAENECLKADKETLIQEHNALKDDYLKLARGFSKTQEEAKNKDEFNEYCSNFFHDTKRK